MWIERYSHVMHLVSNVGAASPPSAFEALRAFFPAGTVSGAPKMRAMQIIAELEPWAAARTPARRLLRLHGSRHGDRHPHVPCGRHRARAGGCRHRLRLGARARAGNSKLRRWPSRPRSSARAGPAGGSDAAVIDNYDSFTYNLVQYLGELGADLQVYRNDAITVEELERLRRPASSFRRGRARPPRPASRCRDPPVGARNPILGVCLGHHASARCWAACGARPAPCMGRRH